MGDQHPQVATGLNNLAQLLKATNRLAEAEPLMRRMVGIFLNFTQRTGHQHPHVHTAIGNYMGLLQAMRWSESQIHEQLHALLTECGMAPG